MQMEQGGRFLEVQGLHREPPEQMHASILDWQNN